MPGQQLHLHSRSIVLAALSEKARDLG